MYEVSKRAYGRKEVTTGGINNPCGGLLNPPRSVWTRITRRPVGLRRAIEIADAQSCHAVVVVWDSSEKVHDNGKAPEIPAGWWPADATSAMDPGRRG